MLSSLEQQARRWADEHEFGEVLFAPDGAAEYDAIMAGIGQDQLLLVGPDLIYCRLFDKIGFGAVRTSDDEIFKILVVTRLYRPGSNLKMLRYMAYFKNKYYDEDEIYRYLDEFCWRLGAGRQAGAYDANRDMELVTYEQTKRVLGGAVAVVFHDTTTIYFESMEADVRILGWSKEGKNAADCEKGLKRLEKRFRSDKLTKDKLNNRGYNR